MRHTVDGGECDEPTEKRNREPATMQYQVFEITERDETYRAKQPEADVDVTGKGETPGRAIADYCAKVEGWGGNDDV
jgi:hypothetical protein